MAQATANGPQPTVQVAPGETLTGIATTHGDQLSTVEHDNPQIHKPYLIYPGEGVS